MAKRRKSHPDCQVCQDRRSFDGPYPTRLLDALAGAVAGDLASRVHEKPAGHLDEAVRKLDEAQQEAAHLLSEIAGDDEIMARFKSAKATREHEIAGKIRETVKTWKAAGEAFLAAVADGAKAKS